MDDMVDEAEVAMLCERICSVTRKYELLQGSWQVSVVLYLWGYSIQAEVVDTIADIIKEIHPN